MNRYDKQKSDVRMFPRNDIVLLISNRLHDVWLLFLGKEILVLLQCLIYIYYTFGN